jgi:putative tributyrin esterase
VRHLAVALAGLVAAAAHASAQGAVQPGTRDLRPGTVVTDTLWSQALGARKPIVVYLPPSYAANPSRRYPVAYYLHGAWGSELNWTVAGRIDRVMDSLVAAGKPEMIVAMPDADDSWYATYNYLLTESGCRAMLPQGQVAEKDCVAWPHYDDYLAYDVVRHVDAKYRTLATRERRAIAGLSMGGYGAFTLALQYPSLFAAAASHSGTLWPREMAPPPVGVRLPHGAADSAGLARFVAGQAPRFKVVFGTDSAGWIARDPARLAARLKGRGERVPALFADCGTNDIFLAQNRRFRSDAAALGIPLEYHEHPGDHDWTYWRAHVGESLSWIAARIAGPTPAPRQ